MVMSIDTLDKETWSDTNGDPYWRIRRYEQWLHYIVDEAVPKLRYLSKERNGWDDLPGVIAFGCSLGATHAVNLYLRRPDIFCGCLALSGIYTAHYGFGDYMDELVYMNSPVDYMRNFPEDHPYMELYRSQKAVICCGQGAWEQPDTTWMLKRIFEAKTSLSGWTCGAATSGTTGIGGISRRFIHAVYFGGEGPLRRWRAKVGLRLPAPASTLERVLHPAGRGPNNDSLFPPLAAVIIVAPIGRAIGRSGRDELNAESII